MNKTVKSKRPRKPAKEVSSKKEPNYKIIRLEEDPKTKIKNKITMVKFYAEDNDEAQDYLAEYKKVANKAYTYYIDTYSPLFIYDEVSKTTKKYDSHQQYIDLLNKNTPWWSKTWEWIEWWLWEKWIDKLSSIKWWFADIIYFIKYKQYRKASWALDSYMIDTLQHNVKILLDTKHGISPVFIDEVRKEMHKDEKDFNIEEYDKTHYEVTEEEESRAVELQCKTLQQLLDAIEKYNYYFNHGVADNEETDKKLRSTLPLVKGSYDMLEYKKLYNMTMKQWNYIWDWMRKYGHTLWD